MVERDYSLMSPEELNVELHRIRSLFPQPLENYFSDDSERNFLEELDRRRESEHREAIMKKLENVLTYAPITATYRKKVLDDLVGIYGLGGTGAENPEMPSNAGIFDKSIAKEVERTEYLTWSSVVPALNSAEPRADLLVYAADKVMKELDIWYQEFTELHGEEP